MENEDLVIVATERWACAKRDLNMRHCLCPDCVEETMEDIELSDPDADGNRYLMFTPYARERWAAGIVGRFARSLAHAS